MARITLMCAVLLLGAGSLMAAERPVSPNGISYDPDYLSWQVIAPSYREDKGQIRIITGNQVAVAALRSGKRPLPMEAFWPRWPGKPKNIRPSRSPPNPVHSFRSSSWSRMQRNIKAPRVGDLHVSSGTN